MIQKNTPIYSKFGNSVVPEMPDCYFISFDLTNKDIFNAMILYQKNVCGINLKEAKDMILASGDILVFKYKTFEEWTKANEEFTETFKDNVSWKIYCNDELKGNKEDPNNPRLIAMASCGIINY